MKKRRTLIISLLLIAALALGIGYALEATYLHIDGIARVTPDQNNLKVEFTNATPDASAGGTHYVTGALGSKTTEATIDATGFTTKCQSGTVTYTIQNNGAYIANVSVDAVIPTHAADEAFHVEVNLPDDTDNDDVVTLNPGESTTVEVTVTLKVSPLEEKEATIKVTLKADPQET